MVLMKGSQIPPTMTSATKSPQTEGTILIGAKVTCVGLGNAYMRPLGYIIIQVQVDRVQGYDKDQTALVILDLSNFVAQIPVILGTPTIG